MAALAGRVAGDASAAARTVTTGEYAAGAGRAQRVLSKPAAVSPTYHAAARCRTRGSHPPTGLWLVISGHGVRTLLLFIRTRTHALYAAATLDAD